MPNLQLNDATRPPHVVSNCIGRLIVGVISGNDSAANDEVTNESWLKAEELLQHGHESHRRAMKGLVAMHHYGTAKADGLHNFWHYGRKMTIAPGSPANSKRSKF